MEKKIGKYLSMTEIALANEQSLNLTAGFFEFVLDILTWWSIECLKRPIY